jgi:hypothetical protein
MIGVKRRVLAQFVGHRLRHTPLLSAHRAHSD